MSDGSAKQQIVDKIKSTTNILVTVSNNPTVDELSAALGLTLLLNKMKKHATAVFSGEIPPAITFLEPRKTFENTVDSLRDFIIALDKEKADHLRYKVEGDVVKIFITPYRTTITGDDLDFSQGDYNVEMVLALGVKNQDNLDKALEAHGRILHDATVVTVMAGDTSELGSISWRDDSASSLSEMIVTLSDALKNDRSLIDEQIATAFLAGIVAATERFSNNRTSARVMTMAAQLMGAGANQQLIASKFEEATEDDTSESEEPAPIKAPAANEEPKEDETPPANHDGTTDLSEGESTKVDRSEAEEDEKTPADEEPHAADEPINGTLNVSHEKEGTIDEVAEQTAEEAQAAAAQAAEAKLASQTAAAPAPEEPLDTLPPVVEPATPDVSPADLQKDVADARAEVEAAADAPQLQGAVSSEVWKGSDAEPSFGGTLNATTEAAAEDAKRADADDRNKTILSHGTGYIAGDVPAYSSPINATNAAALKREDEQPIVNPLDEPASPIAPPPPPTLQDIDRQNRSPSGLPPLPDFSTLPPLPGEQQPPAPVNGIPPMPETLGELFPPVEKKPDITNPNDPAQFKIPGQ